MKLLSVFASAITFVGLAYSPSLAFGQQILDTVIERDLTVRLPLGPCDAATAAGMMSIATGVPAGIEHFPAPCSYEGPALTVARESKSMQGMSIREALTFLVEHDPRFVWETVRGVVLFRPHRATELTNHFLSRIGSIQLRDGTIAEALSAVVRILGGKYVPPPSLRTAQAGKRLTLSLGEASVLDMLNEVVRMHGSAWWEVRYCHSTQADQMLYLWTFDKSGLGAPVGSISSPNCGAFQK